ncbi:hypothetical protein P280DRAFT_334636, partial [Massarina eburnea CBS 473.64]
PRPSPPTPLPSHPILSHPFSSPANVSLSNPPTSLARPNHPHLLCARHQACPSTPYRTHPHPLAQKHKNTWQCQHATSRTHGPFSRPYTAPSVGPPSRPPSLCRADRPIGWSTNSAGTTRRHQEANCHVRFGTGAQPHKHLPLRCLRETADLFAARPCNKLSCSPLAVGRR